MREAFQRLVDIPTMIDDDHKFTSAEQDILVVQLMNSDLLRQWERKRKQQAENTIMAAAKIISRQIAATFVLLSYFDNKPILDLARVMLGVLKLSRG
jgi:hypothetical protein